MCFQIDLRAETPVVPLRLRNLEAVTGEEDEGPSEGLVKPGGRFTEVRFNLFRMSKSLRELLLVKISLVQLTLGNIQYLQSAQLCWKLLLLPLFLMFHRKYLHLEL